MKRERERERGGGGGGGEGGLKGSAHFALQILVLAKNFAPSLHIHLKRTSMCGINVVGGGGGGDLRCCADLSLHFYMLALLLRSC